MRSIACPSRRSYFLAKALMSHPSLRRVGAEIAWPAARTFSTSRIRLPGDGPTDAINRVSWEQLQARLLIGAGNTLGHFQWLACVPSISKK